MNKKNSMAALVASMDFLLSTYSAQEIEDTLFLAFERANLLSDGDLDTDRETRSTIHTELRTIFRIIAADNTVILKLIKSCQNNTTEIT